MKLARGLMNRGGASENRRFRICACIQYAVVHILAFQRTDLIAEGVARVDIIGSYAPIVVMPGIGGREVDD